MSETEQPKKNGGIEVSIDTRRTEELARQNERLTIEKEQADLQAKIAQANEEFNTDMFSQARSKDMLLSMIKNHIQDLVARERPHETPAGSPLFPAQMGEKPSSLWTKSYTSYKEMVDDLQSKKATSKEAQSYLDELTRRWAILKRTNPKLDDAFNPNLPENLPPLKNVEGTNARTPLNPEEGDIGSIMARWKKERLAKMGKQIDQNGKVVEG